MFSKKLIFALLFFVLIFLAGCVSKAKCEETCVSPNKCVNEPIKTGILPPIDNFVCKEVKPSEANTEPIEKSPELEAFEKALGLQDYLSKALAVPEEEIEKEVSQMILIDPVSQQFTMYAGAKAVPEEIISKARKETGGKVPGIFTATPLADKFVRIPDNQIKIDSTKPLVVMVDVNPSDPKMKGLIGQDVSITLEGPEKDVVTISGKINDNGFFIGIVDPVRLPLGIENDFMKLNFKLVAKDIKPIEITNKFLVASLLPPPPVNVGNNPIIRIGYKTDARTPVSGFDSSKCPGADQKGESCVGKLLTWCRNVNDRDASYTCNDKTGCCESVSQSTTDVGNKVTEPLITFDFDNMPPITRLVEEKSNGPKPFFVEVTSNKPRTPYNISFTNPKTKAELLIVQGETNHEGIDLAKIFVCKEEEKDKETPSPPNILIVSGLTVARASPPNNSETHAVAAVLPSVKDSHQGIAAVLPTEYKPPFGVTALTTLALQGGSRWTPPHEELACPSTNNRTARFGTSLPRPFSQAEQDLWNNGQAIDNLFNSLQNELKGKVDRKEITPKAAEKQGNATLNQEAASRWGNNAQANWNQYQSLKNQLNQQASRLKKSEVSDRIDRIKKGRSRPGDEVVENYLNCLEGTFSCAAGCSKSESPPTESVEFDLANGRVVYLCSRSISCSPESQVGCNLRVDPENPPEVAVAFLTPLTSLPKETTTSSDPNTPSKDVFVTRLPDRTESQQVPLGDLTVKKLKDSFLAKKKESIEALKQALIAYVDPFNKKVEKKVADRETCFGHNTTVEKLSTNVSVGGIKVSGESYSLVGIETGVGERAKCEKTSCGPQVCGAIYGCVLTSGSVRGFCKPLEAAVVVGENGVPELTRGGTEAVTTGVAS